MHPGETTASWVLHGLMLFLLSKAPMARNLRKRVIFKIIPILNIDGVIGGNYRRSFAGLDLNRMFGEHTNKRLNPEACLLKELAKAEKKLLFILIFMGTQARNLSLCTDLDFHCTLNTISKIRLLPKLV